MQLVSVNKNLVNKGGKFCVDLLAFLPQKTLETYRARKRLPLYCVANEKIINLWSEASWQKSGIKIKRYVDLDSLFFEGLALYAGEGVTKTVNAYNGGIYFGNSEPSILNLFLDWLDSFLLNYNPLFSVDFNGCSVNELRVKSFWVSHINRNIGAEKIKVRLRSNLGSDLIRNYGVLQIRVNNTVLKSFIIELLERTKPVILSNQKYMVDYLRGLLAAEGSMDSKCVLKAVTVGCVNDEQGKFISQILNRLKLNYYRGKNQFSITGWESFYILYKMNAFEIMQINNYSKKQRFLDGLKAHRFTQNLIKLRDFAGKEFTAQDWSKKYGLKSYISGHRFLKRLVIKEFLNTSIKNRCRSYRINSKKQQVLTAIWNL